MFSFLKTRLLLFVVFFAGLATAAAAADDAGKSNSAPDTSKAAASDDSKKQTTKPAPAPSSAKSDNGGKSDPAKDAPAKVAGKESPTNLAPVEVKRNRLIEIDRKILDLQDEIASEKKKMKSTESDKALNNEKVSSALSIFGGSSSRSREELARERVSLMETELDLLEMASRAKTKAEHDDLESQANDLRTMRRNLERGGPSQ